MKAGPRDKLISIQRLDAALDDAGHPTANADWSEVCQAFAGVYFGSGSEQRQAAQEAATQTATFEVPISPETSSVTPADRLCFPIDDPSPAAWPTWDISAVAPMPRNDGVRITATRKVA